LGSSAPLPPIVSTHTHVEMEHDHARLPTYKLAIFVEELDLVQHADIASDDEAAVTFVGLSLKARFSGTLSVFRWAKMGKLSWKTENVLNKIIKTSVK
jgi:hypothetical protein